MNRKSINKRHLVLSGIFLTVVLVGILMYPVIRGITKEQFDSIEATSIEIDNPEFIQMKGEVYKELIIVFRYFNQFKASVYYNSGEGLISYEDFQKIDTDEIKKDFDALTVVKNGPRFWVLDKIKAYRASEDKNIAGHHFIQPAVVNLTLKDIRRGSTPYKERTVERNTTYLYKEGEKVYELISDDNTVYTMQSASLEVDTTLNFDNLDNLGGRLSLPEGWEYSVRMLEEDHVFHVKSFAVVIQDEFKNTYQKNQ